MSVPAPHALASLARKYRTLASLRRAHAAGEPVPARPVLRRLAHEFPGALRELDALPLGEIDRRAERLERAAVDVAAAEPWMTWVDGYHAWMRAALALKIRVGRGPMDDARVVELAREVATRTGLDGLDAAFVRAVAAPPDRRLGTVVLDRLAALHGDEARAVRDVMGRAT